MRASESTSPGRNGLGYQPVVGERPAPRRAILSMTILGLIIARAVNVLS